MNTSVACQAAGVPIAKDSSIEKRLAATRKKLPYQMEYLKGTFSDELWQAMEHRDFTQARFARRAKVSKQFITKVFRNGNCTMETMAKLAFALDYTVHIHLTPNDMGCAWIHRIIEFTDQRPAQRFTNLLTDSGYQPMANLIGEVKVKSD